jgi:hypothetical protein
MCDGNLYMTDPVARAIKHAREDAGIQHTEYHRCGNCDRWCGTTVGMQHKEGECLADAKPLIIKHGEYWLAPKEYFNAWHSCHRTQDWRQRND